MTSTITWDRSRASLIPHSLFDGMSSFLEEMRRHGLAPVDPHAIVPDGVLHRYTVVADKPSRKNGWYVLNPLWGVAGSFKSGVKFHWHAGKTGQLSLHDRRARMQAIRTAQALREQEQAERYAHAAEHGAALWGSLRPATPGHPYLARKHVPPGPARQLGGVIFLPVTDLDGKLHGLQLIDDAGFKWFLKGTRVRGHFVQIVGHLPNQQVVIGEGYATCASVAPYFSGATVLAALNCGNLLPVAQNVRARYPDVDIVIAADDDQLNPANPGLTAARVAAAAVDARVARPKWPPEISPRASDFNDLANYLREHHG